MVPGLALFVRPISGVPGGPQRVTAEDPLLGEGRLPGALLWERVTRLLGLWVKTSKPLLSSKISESKVVGPLSFV